MSVFEHSRWRIFNPVQHPYRHALSEFQYSNPRLPDTTDLQSTLDYIVAVLYPNYIGTYPTPADLPATASLNDYAIVSDDGDGKSAGYVYSHVDNTDRWIKRYDMDWSVEGVLTDAVARAAPLFVNQFGKDDLDDTGTPIAGTYAGQRIYGGRSSGTNLTLSANAGDTAGVHTGYVQLDDALRPVANGAYDLGTTALRFRDVYTGRVLAGTLTLGSGSIMDSSGAIDFGLTALSTAGNIEAANALIDTAVAVGLLTLSGNSITSSSGAIDLGANTLTTTGTVTAATGSKFGNLTVGSGAITDTSGAISFDDENLSTTGTFAAGAITGTSARGGNLRLAANLLASMDTNGEVGIQPNGSGATRIYSALQVDGQLTLPTANLLLTAGRIDVGSLRLSGSTLSVTAANTDLTLQANGSGILALGASAVPGTASAFDLGSAAKPWRTLYLGGLHDGTNAFTGTDLMRLRNMNFRDASRTAPAQAGDALFYDAVSGTWLASHPDLEIAHSELAGLTTGDAGHTQFVLLSGRSGGQAIQGGTLASNDLILESTAHASKGSVRTRDNLTAATDAAYSAGWSGADLGDATHYFRDVYTRGVHKGFRLESYTSGTLPAASAANSGRAVWSTDNKKIYVDTGGTWLLAGSGKWLSDTVWNGSIATLDVDVSASIQDARTALWQLCDNTNSYERIFCSIRAISATTVRITVGQALPAGSYRLIGIE